MSPSPEEVKDFLVNRLDVRENRIAIATGSTKDLDGVDLMDRKCPIEVVITINALKEGWDCPFAYVLCSLQDMKSAKDVEQLIGRIMRMPYAKRRLAESLNKAYATVLSSSTYDVAESLRSNLVDSMGFSRQMAAEMIEEKKDDKSGHSIFRDDYQPSLFEDDELNQTKRPDIHLKMTDDPREVLRKAGLEGKAEVIRTRPSATDEKVRVVSLSTPKALSPEEVNRLTEALKKESKKVRDSNEIALTNYQLQHRVDRATRIQEEVRVIDVPCFCFVKDGHVEEVGTNLESWAPLVALGVSPQIDFRPRDTVRSREVDVNEAGKVVAGAVQNGSRTINPRLLDVGYSEDDLVKALARDLARPDVTFGNMVRFVGACVRSILNDEVYSVERLVQNRVQLKKLFANLLEKCRETALRNGIEQQLDLVCEAPEQYHFHFEPGKYEPRNIYDAGSTGKDFEKHFYPQIHDLHEKTPGGVEAEEYRCACVIDDHPAVKTWVRNVERSKYAFRLALTDGGYFYPDFVALLTDGRILVVEYKGENLISNDDSKLKNRIGKLWAKASNGKALFAMVTKRDELGNDLYEQLDRVIRGE